MQEKSEGFMLIESIVSQIRRITNFVPKIGVVLGSGLGSFSEEIRVIGKIPYSKLKNFPVSTVSGHNGQFIFGYVNKIPVVLMDGRVHYYEGYNMFDVVLPDRIMAMLGAGVVILTNAAGGIEKTFYPGLIMSISDHISTFVPSPLLGPNIEEIGARFPDMSHVYNKDLRMVIYNTAQQLRIPLREGVYLQTTGPQYETPAEIKMFDAMGADAVGMSTAVEAIALNHMGVRVCGLSLITNMAAGLSKGSLSHEEVKKTADEAGENFKKLLLNVIININELLKQEEASLKNKDAVIAAEQKKKEAINNIGFEEFDIIEIK